MEMSRGPVNAAGWVYSFYFVGNVVYSSYTNCVNK